MQYSPSLVIGQLSKQVFSVFSGDRGGTVYYSRKLEPKEHKGALTKAIKPRVSNFKSTLLKLNVLHPGIKLDTELFRGRSPSTYPEWPLSLSVRTERHAKSTSATRRRLPMLLVHVRRHECAARCAVSHVRLHKCRAQIFFREAE